MDTFWGFRGGTPFDTFRTVMDPFGHFELSKNPFKSYRIGGAICYRATVYWKASEEP